VSLANSLPSFSRLSLVSQLYGLLQGLLREQICLLFCLSCDSYFVGKIVSPCSKLGDHFELCTVVLGPLGCEQRPGHLRRVNKVGMLLGISYIYGMHPVVYCYIKFLCNHQHKQTKTNSVALSPRANYTD
jgi:hypothetical protein